MYKLHHKRIAEVIAHAKSNPYSLDKMKKVADGHLPPAGDYQDFVVDMGDIRCVYSIEEQPCGTCAHLSVSSPTGDFPNPHDFEIDIMPLFGMGNDIHDCMNVWLEKTDDAINAINVLKLVEGKSDESIDH